MRPSVIVLLAIALAARGAATEPRRELRVSAIPDEAPRELASKFAPLGRYLEKRLGVAVVFVPAPDYSATVEWLASKRIDLVWYGGFTFVQAKRRTGDALPLVQRTEDAAFHSKFIVPAGSRARTLDDLKGHSFAFGSISSTSGHLMPRYFLMKHGIDPDKDFSKVVFAGAHDATARMVENGEVDAGALNESVFQKLLDEKKLDASKIRVLWTTPDYPDYNWTVRGDLDRTLVDGIRDAFLALDYAKPDDRALLDLQRTKKFIPTSADNYDGIEVAARAARLIRESR